MCRPLVHHTRQILCATALIGLTGCVVPTQVTESENVNGSGAIQDPAFNESLSNTAPIASAGDDKSFGAGDLVTLDGTASRDADGQQLSFIWTQLPGAPEVEFDSSPFSAIVTFEAPAVAQSTTLIFSLAVLDGFAASFDQVSVTITP